MASTKGTCTTWATDGGGGDSGRDQRPAPARWLLAAAAFLAPLAALSAVLAYPPTAGWLHSFETDRFHGRDVAHEDWRGAFELLDASGHTHRLSDFAGKMVFVAFGYTRCPDACPTTLARLAKVRTLLGDDARKTAVVFITIDPERDAPAMLDEYVRAFDADFLGLHGDDGHTDAAARAFHADYRIIRHGADILVEHTVDTYLVDPRGQVRLVFPYDLSAQEVADDTRAALRDAGLGWPWG